MVPGDVIGPGDLGFLESSGSPLPPETDEAGAITPLHQARDRFERDYILRALAAQHGNISRTADVLGVERSNLYRKMRGFGIGPERLKTED